MSIINDFEKDKMIDIYNLEEEWLNQPDISYRYCVEVAEVRKAVEAQRLKVERLKSDLDETEASVTIDVTQNPEKYELPKTTDALIKAAVEVSTQVQAKKKECYEAKEKLNDLYFDLNMTTAAMQSVTIDRRQGLSGLQDLWSKMYYQDNNNTKEKATEVMRNNRRNK